MNIYQIDSVSQYLCGVKDIPANGGCPLGWTRTEPPVLRIGEYAVWQGTGWAVTTQLYSAPTIVEKVEVTPAVSMRQARLALLQNNLLDAVNAAVGQMPQAAQIEWEYATEVRRDNALVAAMQGLLGWTDVQMDGLFTLAATL